MDPDDIHSASVASQTGSISSRCDRHRPGTLPMWGRRFDPGRSSGRDRCGRLGVVPGVVETSAGGVGSVTGWTARRAPTRPTPIAACSGTPTWRDRGSCSSPRVVDDLRGTPAGRTSRRSGSGYRCVRTARESCIEAALALGAGRASLHRWRGRYAAGGIEALRDRPRGPGPVSAAGLGRAGAHRGPSSDALEQQAPGGRVHPPGHLPARPPRGNYIQGHFASSRGTLRRAPRPAS